LLPEPKEAEELVPSAIREICKHDKLHESVLWLWLQSLEGPDAIALSHVKVPRYRPSERLSLDHKQARLRQCRETECEKKDDAHSYDDEVWGLVYSLEQEDEDRLDGNEGVPVAYTKEDLTVDYWPAKKDGSAPDTEEKPAQTEMLVYINRELTKPHEPKEEYIYRMNMGIKDALKEGMPQGYVDDVMRAYIPDRDEKM